MPNFNLKNLRSVQQNIHNYLKKNDDEYRRGVEQRRAREIKQLATINDLTATTSKLTEVVKKYQGEKKEDRHDVTPQFLAAIDKLGKSVNESLVAAVGATITSLTSKDAHEFFRQLRQEDVKLIASLVGTLSQIQQSLAEIKFPEVLPFPKQFSLAEAKKILAQLEAIEGAIKKMPTPEGVKFPTSLSLKEATGLNNQLINIERAIKELPRNINLPEAARFDVEPIVAALGDVKKQLAAIKLPQIEFPDSISINNFPPQKVPQPVTNININPLRGVVHTSTTTASTTLSTLPGYGVLENRRSVIFYNNSSTVTAFIGGSNVTTSNGIPIAPESFSPSFDSGPRQIWYGVTSSGTADVRCVEISNDAIGG